MRQVLRPVLSWLLALLLLPAWGLVAGAQAQPEERVVKRTILALYDRQSEETIRLSRVGSYATMPLHQLGLKVVYHNIRDPLPTPETIPDLRGVVTWFGGNVPDQGAYLRWATALLEQGVPFAVLGDPGMTGAPADQQDRFLRHLGLEATGDFRLLTYDMTLSQGEAGMIGFERAPMRPYPSYTVFRQGDAGATLYLAARGDDGVDHPLVIIGGNGGFAGAGYEYYFDPEIVRGRWIIDPFAFFARIFRVDGLPRPDATTLAGRRIYFSHVDGDGWRNISRVPGFRDRESGATRALFKKAWEAYPDLPVTVAPIGAELDTRYFATAGDLELARELFALPHVEAGTHTYSHPFVWSFFRHYDARKEQELEIKAGRAPSTEGNRWDRMMASFNLTPQDRYLISEGTAADEHPVMRAFANVPWSLDNEIAGSARQIGEVLPAGKKVALVQWPGDTSPFPKAVRETRAAGMSNMNGGDPRFDPEYPSVLFVSGLAFTGNGIVQPYAQASNENTYTNLWSERYYGLRYLAATLRNTERPRRLKPFNLYYHNYSGEFPESLEAVVSILDLARASEIAPIEASRYAAIVDGFQSARIVATGDPESGSAWRIENRGALNTIRFDDAAFKAVDFDRSAGVIGQRHYQGSLYVALDPAAQAPVVALTAIDRTDIPPVADRPYLIEARWPLRALQPGAAGAVTAEARGYGAGAFTWRVEPGRSYAIRALADGAEVWRGRATADAAGRLAFTVDADGLRWLRLELSPEAAGTSDSAS